MIICLLYHKTKNKQTKLSYFALKYYRIFTFAIYIRFAIELYMLTVLMLVSEIKYYIKNNGDDTFGHQQEGEDEQDKGNYVSFTISLILLLISCLFLFIAFISWMKIKDILIIGINCKTKEFYNGICKVPKTHLPQQDLESEKEELQVQQQEDQKLEDESKEAHQQDDESKEAHQKDDESKEVSEHKDEEDEVKNEGGESNEFIELEQSSYVPQRIKIARLYYFLFLARRLIVIFIVVLIPSSYSLYALKI